VSGVGNERSINCGGAVQLGANDLADSKGELENQISVSTRSWYQSNTRVSCPREPRAVQIKHWSLHLASRCTEVVFPQRDDLSLSKNMTSLCTGNFGVVLDFLSSHLLGEAEVSQWRSAINRYDFPLGATQPKFDHEQSVQ